MVQAHCVELAECDALHWSAVARNGEEQLAATDKRHREAAASSETLPPRFRHHFGSGDRDCRRTRPDANSTHPMT